MFLLAFTLLRGAVWAMTFPSFYGPDEDYHYLYIEYLTTQHELPSKDKELYPEEYVLGTNAMNYDGYYGGPRADFVGDPHATTRELEVTDFFREPRHQGRGVGVVHPPLYHAAGWVVNASLGDASFFTRYDAIRWMSSVFGVLAVFAAWLLAAQVFRNEGLRLLVAFLVAVQPMIGVLSGIANHDILLIATVTLSAAMLLFLLRAPPRARQGLWVGIPIALALLVKATALLLIPLAALAYAVQWLVNRPGGREVLRSMALAGAVVLVGAGWWYLGSLIVNDTVTGQVGEVAKGDAGGFTISSAWDLAKSWTGFTYRTYWFHHFWYEAPKGSLYFYLPGYVGTLGMLGLVTLVWRRRRTLLAPERPLLRQAVFMVLLALAFYVPLLLLELRHWYDGQGFSMTGGRYLLPAYAGVATLLVAGLRELFDRRAHPLVFSGLALLGALMCWRVWTGNYVHRYYGGKDASWQTIFHNMSFDRPEFVTATSLRVAVGLIFASLAGAALAVVVGHLPPGARNRVRLGRPALRRRVTAPTP